MKTSCGNAPPRHCITFAEEITVNEHEVGTAADALPYAALARRFVNSEISAVQFEELYLDLFRQENRYMPKVYATPINEIFYSVEDYVVDPALRDEGDLDDDQLKQRVSASLRELLAVLGEE